MSNFEQPCDWENSTVRVNWGRAIESLTLLPLPTGVGPTPTRRAPFGPLLAGLKSCSGPVQSWPGIRPDCCGEWNQGSWPVCENRRRRSRRDLLLEPGLHAGKSQVRCRSGMSTNAQESLAVSVQKTTLVYRSARPSAHLLRSRPVPPWLRKCSIAPPEETPPYSEFPISRSACRSRALPTGKICFGTNVRGRCRPGSRGCVRFDVKLCFQSLHSKECPWKAKASN